MSKNNTHYTLCETIGYIKQSNPSVYKFHLAAVKQVPLIIICSLKTLYRHYEVYNSTGPIHVPENDGIAVGRTKLVPDLELHKLNTSLETIRFADGVVGLKNAMI